MAETLRVASVHIKTRCTRCTSEHSNSSQHGGTAKNKKTTKHQPALWWIICPQKGSLREVFARHPGQILTFESAWNSNRYVLHLNFHPTLHVSNLFQPWISGWQHWLHVVCSLLPWGFWPAFHRWGCCRCRTLQLAQIKNRKKSHLHGRWSRLVAQCLCMEARNTVLSFREEPEVSHAPLTKK